MSELTLLLLKVGFLVLMWFFVFAVIYALRADLFGTKVRKMPEPAAAGVAPAAAAPAPPRERSSSKSSLATTRSAGRIVITSGPKAGLDIPLGTESLTIGRSSEAGLVIRDDYTSSQHARLVLSGDQWMIQDLDSTNGTWHDGQKLTGSVPVRLGAPIKVGATTFELRK